MSSTAISGKGSTFSIGTSSGSANNITAISLTNPCRITLQSSVSGLSVGDVVAIASITGTTQLNGVTAVIEYIEPANKIITLAGINALAYTEWTSGGTVTPVVMTEIANVLSFSGLDGSNAELDVTNLSSTAKEFISGMVDEGGFSIDVHFDNANAGQLALAAARSSGTLKNFKLVLPNSKTATFSGLVKKFNLSGGVDQAVKRSCDMRISGPVVWS
ncbi:MAG: phage tail protein [Magnetococcales bacterium]|nr:phage tail protein [Magnetococcales bacterium]